MGEKTTSGGLDQVYELGSAQEARAFYDRWAGGYEAELTGAGYMTPRRCAEALAAHAAAPWAPLLEIGCGTGLGGLALQAAGFECIDGFDISEEMLRQAGDKGIYRTLGILDLSRPLDAIAEDAYQNAAAIGVLNPSFIPPTVIDEVVSKLPAGGCFVFSANDRAVADGSIMARVLEITEHGIADLMVKDYGTHIPDADLQGWVLVLKKR